MQNQGRILRLIVLIVLNIIALASVVVVVNFTYAQYIPELHQKTLEYLSRLHISSKQVAHITIGNPPIGASGWHADIAITPNKVYVANFDDNTVSVIDRTTNKNIKNITVGTEPDAIAMPCWGDTCRGRTVYVANFFSNNVSVINGATNEFIKNIPVGTGPDSIAISTYVAGDIYIANRFSNTVSVINGTTNEVIKSIPVGRGPSKIVFDGSTNTIYVANLDSNTVSVINGTTNEVIKSIPVGRGPIDMAIAESFYSFYKPPHTTIYVANFRNNTVSVIDGATNEFIKNIPVWDPHSIATLDGPPQTIYVTSRANNAVAVINGTSNEFIKSIPVGNYPLAVGVDEDRKVTYVVNQDNTVSVIDGETNNVVARVMFNIEPFNSGYIECGNAMDKHNLKAPISEQLYVYSGSECIAKPYQGYEFLSWQENVGRNSTQLINLLPPASISDSILDFFHMNPDKPEAILNITKFGNFTANFRPLPAPIPPEYVATLIGVVATAFIGTWLTPALIGWRKIRMQRKYFKECINQIGRLDKKTIENKVIAYYADGNLSDVQHQLLNDKISEHYAKEKGSERYGAPIG